MATADSQPLSNPPAAVPFFSVVTVCRNAEACIKTAAGSLVEQSCTDWEWIVIDGASTDGTLNGIREIAPDSPKVHILSEPDSGIFEAMNKGVRLCRGRYIHFLNADDSYADLNVLAEVKSELLQFPETDFLYGKILLQRPGQEDTLGESPEVTDALATMVCGCLPHQASFSRRDLFLGSPGLFDELLRTSGDYKWMMQVVSNPALKLRHMDRVIARYSVDGASAKLEKSLPESFKVLNECAEFHRALGSSKIIEMYQKHVLALRIALQEAQQKVTSTSELAARRKEHLMKAKERAEQLGEDLKRERTKSKRFPLNWLSKWFRTLR